MYDEWWNPTIKFVCFKQMSPIKMNSSTGKDQDLQLIFYCWL
jgi:hypothetical protein